MEYNRVIKENMNYSRVFKQSWSQVARGASQKGAVELLISEVPKRFFLLQNHRAGKLHVVS